jgi:uncharacterized protein (TIGR02271 family)
MIKKRDMTYEKIVTAYDTDEHAEQAVRALVAAGFSSSDISKFTKESVSSGGAAAEDAVRGPGFWHRLFGRDIEEHERTVYGSTIESGGVIVTLRVPSSEVARAMAILNAHKAVDVHERASAIGLTPVGVTPPPLAPQQPAAKAAGAVAGNQDLIRLAEEQLNVGKRLVQAGTTRIRRFVVEKPVEAQVTLHEEHAEVLRRAVSDPSFVKDIEWGDQTIEVQETAEEAVVSKTARVVEEVDIRKVASERVETVHDTVRRQQVEVERAAGQITKTPSESPKV